jgi:hypothetical protein
MKTLQQSSEKYIRNSIRAFLNNETGCNEVWLTRVAVSAGEESVRKALAVYASDPRLTFLRKQYQS